MLFPSWPKISSCSSLILYGTCLALLAVVGCEKGKNTYVAPPPPKVTVAHPVAEEIVETRDYTGTTKAFEAVEILARVEGFLDAIEFEDGADVKHDQLLSRIDPKPFAAVLAQAKASLALAQARRKSSQAELSRADAELANMKTQLRRVEDAQSRSPGAVTEAEIDMRRTAVMTADAAVESAQAAIASSEAEIAVADAEVTKAELNLSYTEIHSPIAGRVGQKNFDVGSLVGTPSTKLLTTVVRTDPIYAYFTVSEQDFLRFNRERIAQDRSMSSTKSGGEARSVMLGLGDEEGYPHQGIIDFADLALDESTGTFLVRARFDNPDELISPGAFVRISIPMQKKPALLVSETAVGRDQGGAYLLVVNDKNEVEMKRVTLGGKFNRMQIVSGGDLTPEDRVVVEGIQMSRPGAVVTPVEKSKATSSAEEGTVAHP
ncbi:efflux RND transporter periplasmic adaptor subunit [Bythopirellula goksoeyrii]|uniref:Efflux pump periplasmic linker BepF n=1 Tax=Bythopirellula goksoeyrii TaxID=1400387 RepID=A0A5B9QJV3_9BACT|nr:efflux RND transporter periplasmic adaptor subunit [Bythopirellula goksoeyrii]QEG37815.1 Efflux pump periplasmic linker BepF [Bythopirellula goksoeyrii]